MTVLLTLSCFLALLLSPTPQPASLPFAAAPGPSATAAGPSIEAPGPSAAASGLSAEAPATEPQMRFRDTLRTAQQKAQFRRALELAPTTFICDRFTSDGRGHASVRKLRFNDTMRRVIHLDFVQQDPFLHKQMRRLYFVTRPFGVTGDLSVRYHSLPDGSIATLYEISELRIWGRRASDRLIAEILRANGAR